MIRYPAFFDFVFLFVNGNITFNLLMQELNFFINTRFNFSKLNFDQFLN